MIRQSMKHLAIGLSIVATFVAATIVVAWALEGPLDPANSAPLACELVSTPGAVPRSAENIVHVANVCGIAGTDIEFQSRTAADGTVHDYAFVGTLGSGARIFDVTDPFNPTFAGAYLDPGWQNDVQVRGDTLVIGFDWLVVGGHASTCLKNKAQTTGAAVQNAGVDIVDLIFDPVSATFTTSLRDCYLSSIPSAGAHTTTIHPSGDYLTVNTSFAGLEIVDIRGSEAELVWHVGTDVVDEAHDVSFSGDGNTLYSAGIASTRIADVSDVFNREPTLISVIPNDPGSDGDGHSIEISHQSDVSSDGEILVVTDEDGGGLSNTECNENGNGIIGAMHFWALKQQAGVANTAGASPADPKKIGTWLYPNPALAVDPLQGALDDLVLQGLRTERGCTIHVFRNGGNGSVSPGPIQEGFDGVSGLPDRQLVAAHYGAGVWWIDFSAAPSDDDGIVEDSRTTWGNTLGYNVMPGADTWSAKEYKGFIYAGDMARGFDVYGFSRCEGIECALAPPSTPGKATGGGQVEGTMAELTILEGTSSGSKASFGFNAKFTTGLPTGNLTYHDKALGWKVKSTGIDSYSQNDANTSASFTGTATVNGEPGYTFEVDVTDSGEPGSADTFTIMVTGPGGNYTAGGVLTRGNIQVHG